MTLANAVTSSDDIEIKVRYNVGRLGRGPPPHPDIILGGRMEIWVRILLCNRRE